MNATCKRLLSWLVVVTMVLSLVPVVDLSGFAITTKAALSEEEQTAKTNAETVIADAKALKDTFKDKTGTVEAICPVCGGDEVQEWVPFTSEYVNNTTKGHYYLTEDFTDSTAYSNAHDAVLKPINVKVCFNLNGKNLTAEKKKAISVINSVELNIIDTAETEGVVKGYFKSNGGAGQTINMFNSAAVVNIYGGTYQKITSDAETANSTQRSAVVGGGQGTFNWFGGKIDGTLSHTYKNNYVAAGVQLTGTATFNMYGGSIINCESTGSGGAVNVGYTTSHSSTVFNMLGGTVSGNISAACGGNFYVFGTLNVKGGTIENGVANGVFNSANKLGGGNISLNVGTVTVSGGTISGGVAKGSGGNIHVRDNTTGKIIVSGGKIIDGKSSGTTTEGRNIWVNSGAAGSELKISGGKISSDIFYGANTAFELSGNPEIKVSGIEGQTVNAAAGFAVTNGGNLDVSKITGGEIQIEGVEGDVFSATCNGKAAEIAQYFVPTDPGLKVVAENDQLKIAQNAPEVGVFEPWKHGGYAYCPVCGGGEPVEWTDFNTIGHTAGATLAHGHYYLSAPITDTVASGTVAYIKNTSGAASCFNLNGQNLTVENGRVFGTNNQTIRLNIMDTAGTAVVTGNGASTGAVFHVGGGNAGSNFNIYGGTYTSGNNATAIYFTGNGGTVTLKNSAVINGTEAVFIQGGRVTDMGTATANYTGLATFNMEGGTINGTISIGAVSSGSTNATTGQVVQNTKVATFNMTGGTVNGDVSVRNDNTLTVANGTINGKVSAANNSANTNYEVDGKCTITLTGNTTITQLNVGEDVVVDISGMTGGTLAVSGKTGEALFAENANVEITSFAADKYVAVEDGKVCLKQCPFAVVTAEGKVYFESAAEAVAADGAYIEIHADNQTITVADDQVIYVDNCGYTVNVNGEGALYAMDAANDDYVGYGAFVVADGVTVVTDVINPINGNRYIVIKNTEEGTAYSAHRVELELTHVSLRTSQAGLYYKAAYKCDGTLAGRVNAFGIVFSGVDGEIHQGNFDAVEDIYSIAESGFTPDENHTVNGTSVAVFGIFKDGRTAAENVTAGELKIHATPYINVDADANGVSEADNYVLGNVQNDTYKANAGVVYKAMSLYDVLKSINDNWAAYESAQEQVKKFYQKWATKGMDAWATDLANIANA